jgi:hypothetical protein
LRFANDRIGVVLLALFLGRQDGIRVTKRLKPGLGIAPWISVGMQLHGKRAIGRLDLRRTRARFKAKRSIISSVITAATTTLFVTVCAHR